MRRHQRIDPACIKWREPRGPVGRWLDLRGRGKWCSTCRANRKAGAGGMNEDGDMITTKSKRWFAVTTWNADRQDKWLALNRINGHIIGVVLRLPDGESSSGRVSHHSLSVGRYCRH